MTNVQLEDVRTFWDENPCNSDLSEETDRRAYYDEIERARYSHEWHIPRVARFDEYRDRSVLEIGCGMATDGLQFARAGARYTGVDLTAAGIAMAEERFALYGESGRFHVANAEELPLPDSSFDHVYSFGVLMASPHPERIVAQIHRVLRPGGTVGVMVYNKTSINYYVEIMFLRRMLLHLLRPSFMPRLLARVTGLDRAKLERHRELLRANLTKPEWLNLNTDGPDCPLSGVYTDAEARELFAAFNDVRTEVWFFDRTHWPLIGRVMPRKIEEWLGRRFGWHRMVYARKPV